MTADSDYRAAVSNRQNAVHVRQAVPGDVPRMVSLSREKRASYARVRSQFWRPSADADDVQARFFGGLLAAPDHQVLVAEDEQGDVVGFCITRLVSAPPVYDPGGPTATIDDFCVADGDSAWLTVGRKLLTAARELAAQRGAVQLVVVAGAHDSAKRRMIERQGLSETSIWYTGPIA